MISRTNRIFGVILALPACALGAEHITARGVVFLDTNADGIRQASERGIDGVLVTDGRRVVRSGPDGSYTIEIDAHDAIISVVKPRGYAVRHDGQNIPRFYYIHRPGGSPDAGFNFPGVAPTGPLPASIDFPLTPSPSENDSFTVALLGDPQPYSQQEVEYFRRDTVEPMLHRSLEIAFGVSLGDLVGDHLALFEPLNEAQALLGVPWYNIYGNHDMNFMSGGTPETEADPDRYAAETYKRVYGPTDYAFQYGKAHFIVLDNVIYQGFNGVRKGSAPAWPGGKRPETGNYRGGLHDHQIEFVGNYLGMIPEEDLVVLMFHIPIEMDGPGVHRIPEKGELFRVLSSRPHTLSVSGHTHIQRHWFFGSEAGYTPDPGVRSQHMRLHPDRFAQPVHHHINAVTASGSWFRGPRDENGIPMSTMACGAPNGYTLLHVDGNEYRSEFRANRAPPEHQMRVTIEQADGQRSIVANIFNGAEGDTVRYRLSEPGASPGPWRTMTHTPMPDPVYARFRARHAAIPEEARQERPLPGPTVSHHIWTAPTPADGFGPGTSLIEIRHIDLYGVERTSLVTHREPEAGLP
jgi:hypothetical protein